MSALSDCDCDCKLKKTLCLLGLFVFKKYRLSIILKNVDKISIECFIDIYQIIDKYQEISNIEKYQEISNID